MSDQASKDCILVDAQSGEPLLGDVTQELKTLLLHSQPRYAKWNYQSRQWYHAGFEPDQTKDARLVCIEEQTMTNKSKLQQLLEVILKEANKREEGAGYDGEYGDRGASILRTQIEFYEHGMNGTIPPQWKEFQKELDNQLDPEYETYKRLKAKFRE